jgi:hypothetical protein
MYRINAVRLEPLRSTCRRSLSDNSSCFSISSTSVQSVAIFEGYPAGDGGTGAPVTRFFDRIRPEYRDSQTVSILAVFFVQNLGVAIRLALLAGLKNSQAIRVLDRAGNLFAARIYFFYYHIVLPRDNVSPAIRRYSYYIPRLSRPPPACIFLAIFLRQDYGFRK